MYHLIFSPALKAECQSLIGGLFLLSDYFCYPFWSRLHFVCILFKGKINTKRTILSTECTMLLFMKDSGVDLKIGWTDTRIKVIAKY